MPEKRITIDNKAWERLRSARRDDESISDTIMRVVPTPFDLEGWLRRVRRTKLSPEAAEAIEHQVRSRARNAAHLVSSAEDAPRRR